MNRRSFITKALAALAAAPIITRVAAGQRPPPQYAEPETLPHGTITIERYPDPPVWVALGSHDDEGQFVESGCNRAPLKKGDLLFDIPACTLLTGVGIAYSKDGPIEHSTALNMRQRIAMAGDQVVLSDLGF